jgi:hypothetical protein
VGDVAALPQSGLIGRDDYRRIGEGQDVPTKTQRKNTNKEIGLKRVDDGNSRRQRDESWEDRLRLVGDARFIDVEWSGRDRPSWPLPGK